MLLTICSALASYRRFNIFDRQQLLPAANRLTGVVDPLEQQDEEEVYILIE